MSDHIGEELLEKNKTLTDGIPSAPVHEAPAHTTMNAHQLGEVNTERTLETQNVPTAELVEVSAKRPWYKRLFARKTVAKVVRIFKKNGRYMGIEKNFDKKTEDRIADIKNKAFADVDRFKFIEKIGSEAEKNQALEYRKIMEKVLKYADIKDLKNSADVLSVIVSDMEEYLSKYTSSSSIGIEMSEKIKSYKIFFDVQLNGGLMLTDEEKTKTERKENPSKKFIEKWTKVKDKKLFSVMPSAMDVHQGITDDCYMMSALSSLALMRPELIREALRDNGDGTVTVRFFDETVKEKVLKDVKSVKDCGDDVSLALAKVLSSFSEEGSGLEAILREFVTAKVKAEESKEEKKEEKADGTNEELDAFLGGEDDFDVIEMPETKTKSKNGSDADAKLEGEITRKLTALKGAFLTNNEDWIKKISELVLAKNTELEGQLKDLLAQEKSAEDITKDVMRLVLEKIYEDPYEVTRSHDLHEDRYKRLPRYVTVTKEVPTILGIESQARDALWVQMIEKAFAATYKKDGSQAEGRGSYSDLNYSNSCHFLNRFVPGKNYDRVNINSDDPDGEFARILAAIRSKEIITVGVSYKNAAEDKKKSINAQGTSGIRFEHAYSVIDALEINGEKFVGLRDPYGRFRQEYIVSGNEKIKNAKATSSTELFSGDDEGVFYMPVSRFVKVFTNYSGIAC